MITADARMGIGDEGACNDQTVRAEVDYPRLYTLDGAVAYVASKTGVIRPEHAESVAPSQRSDPPR